jgi:hypothetical protein
MLNVFIMKKYSELSRVLSNELSYEFMSDKESALLCLEKSILLGRYEYVRLKNDFEEIITDKTIDLISFAHESKLLWDIDSICNDDVIMM